MIRKHFGILLGVVTLAAVMAWTSSVLAMGWFSRSSAPPPPAPASEDCVNFIKQNGLSLPLGATQEQALQVVEGINPTDEKKEETCDHSNPPVCCEDWVADTINKRTGQESKAVAWTMKGTYEGCIKNIEYWQKTYKMLCRYFGPNESSCYEEFQAPRCNEAPSMKATVTRPETIATLGRVISDGLQALKSIRDINQLGIEHGKKPYAAIGKVTAEYGVALANGIAEVKCIKQALETLPNNLNLDQIYNQQALKIADDVKGQTEKAKRLVQQLSNKSKKLAKQTINLPKPIGRCGDNQDALCRQVTKKDTMCMLFPSPKNKNKGIMALQKELKSYCQAFGPNYIACCIPDK